MYISKVSETKHFRIPIAIKMVSSKSMKKNTTLETLIYYSLHNEDHVASVVLNRPLILIIILLLSLKNVGNAKTSASA